MTQVDNSLVANLPAHLFQRWESVQNVNVMESIHSMKIYNPAPWKNIDENLWWMIMLKSPSWDGTYQPFTKQVRVNILKIRKGINGMFNLLDDNDQIIKEWTETKKWFAFSEEYPRFTRNTNEVFFKSNDIKALSKLSLWDLKAKLKEPLLPNGRKNPYFKLALTRDNQPYNSSHLSEWYIVYWVFKDWEYAWETFRLFMSSSAFGQEWDPQTKITTLVPWSLAAALDTLQKQFKASWIQWYCDDSLLDVNLSSMQSWNFFKPHFSDIQMISYDNTEDFKLLEELLVAYKEQEFGWWVTEQTQNKALTNTWTTTWTDTNTPSKGYYVPTQDQVTPQVTPEVKPEVVSNTKEEAQTKKVNADSWISIEDIPF